MRRWSAVNNRRLSPRPTSGDARGHRSEDEEHDRQLDLDRLGRRQPGQDEAGHGARVSTGHDGGEFGHAPGRGHCVKISGTVKRGSDIGYFRFMTQPRSRLTAAREAAALTQESLSFALGCATSTVARWEQGKSNPKPPLRLRLAEVLEVTLPELEGILLRDLGSADRAYDSGVDRREALTSMVALGVTSAIPGAFRNVLASGPRVGAGDVEQLWNHAWALWRADKQQGGVSVYPANRELCRIVVSLLDEGRYSQIVGRDLHRLHGQALEGAAWTAFDSGRDDLARSHFESALTAARLGDDPGLETFVLAQMSLQANHSGSPREAVELAQLAGRVARPVATDLLMSALAEREALGYARLGEADASREALHRAERLLVDYRHGHDAPWLAMWSEAEWMNIVAQAHLYLGDSAAAETAGTEANCLGQVDYARRRVRYLICLAGAHAKNGNLDQCAATVTDAAALFQGVGSPRVYRSLQTLRPALEGHEAVPGVPEALAALRSA
jgi:transcriptional regulator with XRE-family HTH domain